MTKSLHLIPHSLGHTSTGKIIEDTAGDIGRFSAHCIKWTAMDHKEAVEILRERLRNGFFSKTITPLNFGVHPIGQCFFLAPSGINLGNIEIIMEMHRELYHRKVRS